ncbi:hypothetical protein B9Z55_012759 [Caenorhabditis nigoni]|uniref:Uncharacterized protein n=1 Tax=Caenorhabditis nigoni TaxID=1611254 RepID=A0A2G5TYV1_9PELO|nr:hypothetical protein B9Z55_012759 [Caenorhabditis nigoni]
MKFFLFSCQNFRFKFLACAFKTTVILLTLISIEFLFVSHRFLRDFSRIFSCRMASDLKHLTEKTEKLSIEPLYDTNWCDMLDDIKLECIGKMELQKR